MYAVYVAGSTKPRRQQATRAPSRPTAAVSSGFFSSLFSFASSTPRSPTPAPPPNAIVTKEIEQAREAAEQIKLLEVTETSVLLSVFAVDVNVNLDEKMRQELQRATKKSPPSRMRLELIYVSDIPICFSNLVLNCRWDRLAKTSTIQARVRITSSLKIREVYFKGSELTSRGECWSHNCLLSFQIL